MATREGMLALACVWLEESNRVRWQDKPSRTNRRTMLKMETERYGDLHVRNVKTMWPDGRRL
jgi:hypothetical protein